MSPIHEIQCIVTENGERLFPGFLACEPVDSDGESIDESSHSAHSIHSHHSKKECITFFSSDDESSKHIHICHVINPDMNVGGILLFVGVGLTIVVSLTTLGFLLAQHIDNTTNKKQTK